MSQYASSQNDSIWRSGKFRLFILVAIVVAGYVGYNQYQDYRFERDLTAAQDFYMAGNCADAMPLFDTVIAFGDFSERLTFNEANEVRTQNTECQTYQPAADALAAEDYSTALPLYTAFVNRYPETGLMNYVKADTAVILEASEIEDLVSDSFCVLSELSGFANIAPDPDSDVPNFYLGCGVFHVGEEAYDSAIEIYTDFLDGYASSELAGDGEDALVDTYFAAAAAAIAGEEPVAEDFVTARTYLTNITENHAEHERAEDAEAEIVAMIYGKGQVMLADEPLTAEQYQGIINDMTLIINDYPDHELADEAEAALAQATLGLVAVLEETTELPEISRPAAVPTGEGDVVTLPIQNASPNTIQLILTGDEVYVKTVPACPECQVYIGSGPDDCPDEGSFETFTIEPGTYSVVVSAIGGGNVTPFRGNWELEGGFEYMNCFYIVRQQN